MIRVVPGTKDILPSESWQWQGVEQVCAKVARRYGFHEIRTPIFEETELFARGIGETTDIVGKEMYTFSDKGGDSVTLRPEMTAPVARAVIQHSLIEESTTLKVWYSGPMFRYERPQKGRYRQFHQFGAELLGSANPVADAEIIAFGYSILRALDLTQFELHLNTLGNTASREKFRHELVAFLTPHKDGLTQTSQNRLLTNPLRILDSKAEQDKEILKNAPRLSDCLDDESTAFYEQVKELLTIQNIPFIENQSLVRGLDYYSHTAFEFITDKLGSQNALGGGGRYDGLLSMLGAKNAIPGIGFGLGIERLLLLLGEEAKAAGEEQKPDIYLIGLDKVCRNECIRLAAELRSEDFCAVIDVQNRSFKAQMREANKLGATLVIIIGEGEMQTQTCSVKVMATGEQISVANIDIPHKLRSIMLANMPIPQ